MYRLQENSILRLSDNANIPIDERNRDYQEYLAWLAEGNEPLPIPPDSSIFITNGQARKDRIEQQAEADTKAKFQLMQQQIAGLQATVQQLSEA